MKTVILAGGLGTRLSEETDLLPKPMVRIGELPILHHIMNIYGSYGFNDFIVAAGYKADVVKKYFYDLYTLSKNLQIDFSNRTIDRHISKDLDWKVSIIDTGLNTMTGGRVARLKEHLGEDEAFMLTYGDGLSNVDIPALLDFHKKSGRIATITAVRPPARFGGLQIDNSGAVVHFEEKPQIGEGWINGGFMVFNKKVFDYIPYNDETILERIPFERLAKDRQMAAYKHEGFWQPMDTLREKTLLNDIWAQGNAPWMIEREFKNAIAS